jgi:hypothetical protein
VFVLASFTPFPLLRRVTRDPETEKDLWWGKYSPNYVIDDRWVRVV